MKSVLQFHQNSHEKGRKSLITDAIRYSNDFKLHIIINENEITITKENEELVEKEKLDATLKKIINTHYTENVKTSTWQGLLMKSRLSDELLIKDKCYDWLTKWKYTDTRIINDIQTLYCQMLPTKTYNLIRCDIQDNNTICRLCYQNVESVQHILSSCSLLVKHSYKVRHDDAFKCIVFQLLYNFKLIIKIPPWYSKCNVKPEYSNDDVSFFWDIPEFIGDENEDGRKAKRPDGKLIMHKEKSIYILEMSVPWLKNRESKLTEKIEKYKLLLASIQINYPEYQIKQLTFIMDVLGGYSNHLKENIKVIIRNNKDINKVISFMQKVTLNHASRISSRFKSIISSTNSR